MKDNTLLKGFAILAVLIYWGHRIDENDKIATKANYEEVLKASPKPPNIDSNTFIRGYDSRKEEWIMQERTPVVIHQDYPVDIPSDEEIRIMREKQSFKPGGSYIYTPGRNVPSREEEIQKFIDKHGQEIYEQLEDKYGN